MAPSTNFQKSGLKINILNLPEEIFREIFEYLDVHTLYFTLREVCSIVKNYVDGYIKFSKTIVLRKEQLATTTKLYYFCIIKSDVLSIHSKTIASLPVTDPNLIIMNGTIMMNGKIVFVFASSQSDENLNISAYDPKLNEWTTYNSRNVYTDYLAVPCCPIQWCPIGDSKVLLINCPWQAMAPEQGIVHIVSLNHPDLQNHETQNTFISEFLSLPPLLEHLYGCTLTKVANNKVIITGYDNYSSLCECRRAGKREARLVSQDLIWLGTITNSETDIVWKKNEPKLKNERRHPICFKLKDNLYLAGGFDCNQQIRHCCERYNLTECKYYQTDYVVPDDIYFFNRYHCICIIINEEESIATIVIGKNEGRIILFTENGGFKEVPGCAWTMTGKKQIEKLILSGNLSLKIKGS